VQREVGVLGTGRMGSAIALNLLSKGYRVHVYNRTRAKLEPLVRAGAVAHDTPASLAASADVVMTSLTDHVALHAVLEGEKGLLSALEEGHALIEMSTIGAEESAALSSLVRTKGITWIDSPVFGGPSLIRQGRALLLVGAEKADFDKYRAFLQELGSPIYLGGVTSGHRLKLALNLYLALHTLALCEAMALSIKLGFPPDVIIEVINASHHKSGLTENKGRRMAKGDFSPTFTLNHMLKDVNYAYRAAERTGAVLPLTSLGKELYRLASLKELGELDYSAVLLLLSQLSGIEFRSNA